MARPGYVAYRNTLKALHMEPVEIACGPEVRFQLTAEALRALDPAPAGVIIASPANPTGTIIPEAELKAIAEVCRERGIRSSRTKSTTACPTPAPRRRCWSSSPTP